MDQGPKSVVPQGIMEPLGLYQVLEATGGRSIGPIEQPRQGVTLFRGVSIDSRTLLPGDLFVALVGPNFDGHDFVADALSRGASAAIVSRIPDRLASTDVDLVAPLIQVPDTVRALQDLARYYRKRYDLTVVGVTGTNGKTTTKDMIAAVLGRKLSVCKTQGNLNSQYGLPLTLFQLDHSHQAAVLEMGMSRLGEIERLCEIAQPTIGVITNIGPAHLEFIGNLESIRQAKLELLRSLGSDGIAVVNADDPLLADLERATSARIVSFGVEREATVRGGSIRPVAGGGFGFELQPEGEAYVLPLWGRYNVYNALAAIAVGKILGISSAELRAALQDFRASPLRMERISLGGVELINDAYNANPISVQASLESLPVIAGEGRRIAVLGDMKELGTESGPRHEAIGRKVQALGYDLLVTVGKEAESIARGARDAGMDQGKVHALATNQEAVTLLLGLIHPGDRLLIKGSRAMQMEEVVDGLKAEAGRFQV